jgi:hypothetical protein
VERSEGIPLLAVETVRALVDLDLVIARGEQYVPADGADLDLVAIGAPASLQALVEARIDALTAEEKKVVTDASVLGATFTSDGLIALCCDPEGLQPALDSLARQEIIAVQSDRFSADRGQYRFVQSVVRQVAYATQSRRDCQLRHLAAAEHLIERADRGDELAVLIASHLLDAVDAGQPGDSDVAQHTARACDFLERAAVRARSIRAPAEAMHLLESALDRTTDPADRARLELEAARAGIDAALLADIRRHAVGLMGLGDNASVMELVELRLRAIEGIPGAEHARLALVSTLSRASTRLGDWGAQARYTEQMLLLAEAFADPDALCTAHTQMAIRYQLIGAPATGLASCRTAIGIGREHDLPGPLARADEPGRGRERS